MDREDLQVVERSLERANEQISEIADLLYGQADGGDRVRFDERLSLIDARLRENSECTKKGFYLAMIACIALIAHVVRHW